MVPGQVFGLVGGFVISFALILPMAGCGGDGGTAGTPLLPAASEIPPTFVVDPVPMGKISVAFSDAPVSEEFAQALMVIRRVRLRSAEPDGQDVGLAVSLYRSGLLPLTVDLLQITSFSEILFEFGVPINAQYSAVELWIDSLTLVRPDGSVEPVVLDEGGSTEVSSGVMIAASFIYDENSASYSFGVSESNASGRRLVNVEIPLDLMLRRADDSAYHLTPVALLRETADGLLRLAGIVSGIVEPEAKYPDGAFKICDLVKVSAADWIAQGPDACVFVAMGSATTLFDKSADQESRHIDDLIIGEPVVVYGEWVGSAEENRMDAIQAVLVARGADFERVRGPVSLYSTQDGEFTLAEVTGSCTSAVPTLHVFAGTGALILRQRGEHTVAVTQDDILTCAAAEAEGIRTGSDELRAFAVVLRPPGFTGVLYPGDSNIGQQRFTLRRTGASTKCVGVDEDTEATEYAYHEYWGDFVAWYQRVSAASLQGKEVKVTGLPGNDGCIKADRITHIE